ncbi:MAG: Nramp family divalent metal transporter [Bacteroidota bacterium]
MDQIPGFYRQIGAGLMVAATGIGAGDMIAAAVAGSQFGSLVLWAVLLGALLKWALNEGLAKWDFATDTTIIQGWIQKLPKWIAIYFGAYLVFWAFLVAGTLISFCGLAAHSLVPLPLDDRWAITLYGALHSLVALGLIYRGSYQLIEQIMKAFIALLFLVVSWSALLLSPGWETVLYHSFVPQLPNGSEAITLIMALVGGVGGTLTILCYAYWLREKVGDAPTSLPTIRLDLGIAYGLTAIFGMSIIIIAAGIHPAKVKGYGMILGMAERLGESLGDWGAWAFLIGFWAAVFSSMLGVWHGVPYLFADFAKQYNTKGEASMATQDYPTSKAYRYFLWYIAVPPILLVVFGRPVWIGIAYSVAGAFFMPFLAVLLLYMNNQQKWMGGFRNGWKSNLLLLMGLGLFLVLFLSKLSSFF